MSPEAGTTTAASGAPAYVEVVGSGAAEVVSDLLRVNLAAEARDASVSAAFDTANAALARMLAALREHGVRDSDLRSSSIEVHPDYDQRSRPSGYRASMAVAAVLRDLAGAGTALAAAVEAGGDASRVNGVSLSATTTAETVTEARDAAWADARARAEQYARLAGLSLGAVLSVTEITPPDGQPRPMLARTASLKAAVLEPGTESVSASLVVRWALD